MQVANPVWGQKGWEGDQNAHPVLQLNFLIYKILLSVTDRNSQHTLPLLLEKWTGLPQKYDLDLFGNMNPFLVK